MMKTYLWRFLLSLSASKYLPSSPGRISASAPLPMEEEELAFDHQ